MDGEWLVESHGYPKIIPRYHGNINIYICVYVYVYIYIIKIYNYMYIYMYMHDVIGIYVRDMIYI